MDHLAFPSTSPPRDQCGPLPLAVAGVQAWGGSELGTHALQSVRVVHCSGCPYLRRAASPYIQQPGRGEPYMYPEPGVKCALEWRSPVYRVWWWSDGKEECLALLACPQALSWVTAASGSWQQESSGNLWASWGPLGILEGLYLPNKYL